jgi:phospholipid/cholesterol/gamma-HCH transport system substrate-binding protein
MNLPKPFTASLVAAVAASALSACDYENLNSVTLPGAKGTGDDSYEVRIHVRNALNIVPNSPVRVEDLNVGTIRSIDLVENKPVVTISLDDSVELPANVTAKIGQTSLLGAKHIELISPPEAQGRGRLADGSVISEDNTGNYPETEDVLASAATLLNGGGLAQIKTISTELNKALGGREGTTRQLLRRSARFATHLDEQKGSMVRALHAMNRLSRNFAGNSETINRALESFPPALRVLAADRRRLVSTLESLGQLGTSVSDFVDRGGKDLVRNVQALEPTLKGLADAGTSLIDSLWLVGTVAFPMRTFGEYIRGDYINLWGTVDIGLDTLDRGLLSGTPLAGLLSASENLLGKPANGLSGQAGDPLTDPLKNLLLGQPKGAESADGVPVPTQEPASPPSSNPLSSLLGGLLGPGRATTP